MLETNAKHNYVRWLHELLFSLNVSLLSVLVISLRTRFPVIFVGRKILFYFYSYSHLPVPSFLRLAEPNSQCFLAVVLAAAAGLFLALRLLARFAFMKVILRTPVGIFAVAGLPVACLYAGTLTQSALANEGWLLLELFVVGIYVFLYRYRAWPRNEWVSVISVILHFTLWGWASLDGMWFWLLYPLLGFCSSVIWGVYVKRSGVTQEALGRLGGIVAKLS